MFSKVLLLLIAVQTVVGVHESGKTRFKSECIA